MLVSFDHVSLRYEQNRTVLSDISLSLPEGSFHFLTGASGAGKSSLLKLIYRIDAPSSGKVVVMGHDAAKVSASVLPTLRRKMGVIYQDFRLIPHLTVLENAALPLRLAGACEKEAETHVRDLLKWVGLGDRITAFPAELSGGEQQRVAIARAVVNNPKLLLADEPTGNVDEESSLKLMRLFLELNKMGTAILFATHQRALVVQYGLPVLHLKKGCLLSS